MAVLFLASLVASLAAFNGLPAPAAGVSGAVAAVDQTKAPAPGKAVAGPTQVAEPVQPIQPILAPSLGPRQPLTMTATTSPR